MYVSFNFYLLQNTREYKKRNKKKEDLRNTVYFSTSVKINKNLHNTLRWLGGGRANVPSPLCGFAVGVESRRFGQDRQKSSPSSPSPSSNYLPDRHAMAEPITRHIVAGCRSSRSRRWRTRTLTRWWSIGCAGRTGSTAGGRRPGAVQRTSGGWWWPAARCPRMTGTRCRRARGASAGQVWQRPGCLRRGVVRGKTEKRATCQFTGNAGPGNRGKWNACPLGILKTFLKSTGSIHFAVRRQQT